MKSLFPPPGPADFMPAPSGGTEFGVISSEAALQLGVKPGPIMLQVGYPGPNGWGAKHIISNPDRMSRINEIGFHTLSHYVETVARNYERISDGGGGRLALVHTYTGDGLPLDLELIVLAKDYKGSPIWSVTTAIPKRVSRSKLLYTCPVKEDVRTERSEPSHGDISDRPRRETLSLPKILRGEGKGS